MAGKTSQNIDQQLLNEYAGKHSVGNVSKGFFWVEKNFPHDEIGIVFIGRDNDGSVQLSATTFVNQKDYKFHVTFHLHEFVLEATQKILAFKQSAIAVLKKKFNQQKRESKSVLEDIRRVA